MIAAIQWYLAIGFLIGCIACPIPKKIETWGEFIRSMKEFGGYAFFHTFFWLPIFLVWLDVKRLQRTERKRNA